MHRSTLKIVFAGAAVGLLLRFALVAPTPARAATPTTPTPTSAPTSVEVEKRVAAILARMTLEEKVDTVGGVDAFYVRANKRLGLPAFRMADGPFGVRNVGPSTAYAAGIGLAASWDRDLANRVGAAIGRDARARGVHIMLAPGVNIYRAPMCGRNFEYFGEDPFLASRMAVSYIEGMQAQGVSATVKHFLGNNSEIDRHHTSSEIDERTMREIYLPAFEAAVKEAHVGAVMTSYNLVGGVHMTENAALVDGMLKKEWGFGGVVISDWDATYDGVAAANAGLDIEMPSGKFMNRETLLPAIASGKVSVATLDDKVRRILRAAVRFGWLDRPATDASLPLFSQAGRDVALDAARAGLVLLKNDGGFLPLDDKKIKSIAVIGPDAYPAIPVGGGSAQVRPFSAVSFVEGLANRLRGSATVTVNHGVPTLAEIFDSTDFLTAPTGGKPGLTGEYFNERSLAGTPALTRVDEHLSFAWDKPNFWPTGQRTESAARWSGTFIPTSSGDFRFAAFTYGLDEYRLYIDGKLVLDRARGPQPINLATMKLVAGRPYAIRFEYLHGDHHARVGLGVRRADQFVDPAAKVLAAHADAVVVVAGFDPMTEGEGYDRTFQLPAGQDDLIAAVRAANKKVVVAVTSGGGVDMRSFVDHVPAIIETWYPGEEGGTALAEILFGDVSPSGKLPVTFERRFEDSATAESYAPKADKKVVYSEGVFLGYRHFDKTGRKPLFPFGHGLSYTRFKYGDLAIAPEGMPVDGPVTVSFDVTNVGQRRGAEVAQLYVGDRHAPVPRPPKELKGFAKIDLAPGETKHVQIALDRRALAFFDGKTKQWRAAPGTFEVLVGSSAQQIELRGKLTLR
jgi:beta-glucosidase